MLTEVKKSILGVAVFARTPGSGGKSRLAATLGREKTDRFYELCLDCAADWLRQGDRNCQGYWALTGEGCRTSSLWAGFEILEQPKGSLGKRMHDIAYFLDKRLGKWCLAGTDIPQMTPLAELRLSQQLRHADYIFGPASDGGFWLVAGRCSLSLDIWESVQYSRSTTLEEMVRAIKEETPGATIKLLPQKMTDIDQQHDLEPLLRMLQSSSIKLSRPQERLLEWLVGEVTL